MIYFLLGTINGMIIGGYFMKTEIEKSCVYIEETPKIPYADRQPLYVNIEDIIVGDEELNNAKRTTN